MPHIRVFLGLCSLLLAIVAWGCSGATNENASD